MAEVFDYSNKSKIVLYNVDDDKSTKKLTLVPDFPKDSDEKEITIVIPYTSGTIVTKETIVESVEESVGKVLGDGSAINLSNYYQKSEVDNKIKNEVFGSVYTKVTTDGLLLNKVDKTLLENNYTNNTELKKQMLTKVDKTSVDALIEENNKRFQQLTDDVSSTEQKIAANYNVLSETLVNTKNEVFTKITEITDELVKTSDEIAGKFNVMNKTIADNRTESLNKDQEHDNEIAEIKKKISTSASETNKLVDKAYVDELIMNSSANGITANADGDGFTSLEALKTGPWYALGVEATPKKSDYAIVKSDATHSGNDVRYNYDGQGWVFFQEFKNNVELDLTTAQKKALDSGITTELVSKISANETSIKAEANTRETKDNEITNKLQEETTTRLQKDNEISAKLSKEETARSDGDLKLKEDIINLEKAATLQADELKKLINDNKLDIEAKVGSISTLNTDVTTSVVDAMNDLHDELHNERVAKAGDTMTGTLKIQTDGSIDILHLMANQHGAVLNIDPNSGYLYVSPAVAKDYGFAFTGNEVLPKSTDRSVLKYTIGSKTNHFDNVWTEAINDIAISSFVTTDVVTKLQEEVKALKAQLDSMPKFNTKSDGTFVYTQVEYDSLTDEEKKNGKMYIIVN